MDFTLTEEQEMLRKSARDFLDEKCPKSVVKAMQTDAKGYTPELWKEMADLGWLGLAFPEKYEGSGMSFLDLAVLFEETGRACLPGPFFSSVVLGGMTLLDAGSEEQKKAYLAGISRGTVIMTMALTETAGEYKPEGVEVQAKPSGDGFVINGTKLFVPDGHVATHYLCVVRTSASLNPETGISVFIVDAASPGVKHTVLKTMSGDKQCEVVFENVKVGRDALVGGLNQGWPLVRRAIDRAAVAKCCEMTGMMQRALELTVDYAKDRKQFNRPIGSFQIIQHYCANMNGDIDGARFATYQAAWKISQGMEATREAAIAKAFMGEAFTRVITLAHQVHGAIAVTIDHDLQYYTKRGKAADLSYGDAEFHREAVARSMGL
jgi:alkylation response protein AidB-like acyl-CoA dehydrogenase